MIEGYLIIENKCHEMRQYQFVAFFIDLFDFELVDVRRKWLALHSRISVL